MTTTVLLPPARRVRAGDYHGQKLPAGSSIAQIIMDEQGQPWVVKSINAPQGRLRGDKSSFNDYLAGRMVELVGLPVAEVGLMEIDVDFLRNYYPELARPDHGSFTPGIHFACRFLQGCFTLRDFTAVNMLVQLQNRCTNRQAVNDVVAVDSTLANWDRANGAGLTYVQNLDNLLFQQTPQGLAMLMIDHGYCFAADWNTSSPPAPGLTVGHWPDQLFGLFQSLTRLGWYDEALINAGVTNLQRITLRALHEIADEIPSTWKMFTTPTALDALLIYVLQRVAAYHAVVATHFRPAHARALAG